MLTVSAEFSGPVLVTGAVNTGARSVLATVMTVVSLPESELEAVKITV
jgi:hypothetical protein